VLLGRGRPPFQNVWVRHSAEDETAGLNLECEKVGVTVVKQRAVPQEESQQA